MGVLRSYIEAMKVQFAGIGLKESEYVFNFDHVPNNLIDRSFRIEITANPNKEMSGGKLEKSAVVHLWVVYKMPAKSTGVKRTVKYLDAIDETEKIEDKIYLNITGFVESEGFESSDIFQDFLIFHFPFTINYERSLNG